MRKKKIKLYTSWRKEDILFKSYRMATENITNFILKKNK